MVKRRWKQAWKWFPKLSSIKYASLVSQFIILIKASQRVWGLFLKETLIHLITHNALLMKQPQPMVKHNQGEFYNSSFQAYLSLFECPQSSIHQDMSCGLEKLISQFIWLFWNALRPNFLCVGQMDMIPRETMFLRTIWTTFMFIKNWFEAWKVIIHSKTL